MDRGAIPADAYPRALEVGGVCVWVWDIERDHAAWSPGWTSLIGYASDELAEDLEGSVDLIHPDDLPAVRDELAQVMSGGDRRLEYRLRHRDGSYRWVRGSAHVSRGTGGRDQVVLAVIDVTETRRAAALAEERRQLDDLVRSSVVRLVHIPAAELGGAIVDAMADVARFLGADHAALLLPDRKATGLRIEERWDRDRSEPIVLPPRGELPWWDRQVSGSALVRLTDLGDFPEEADAERRFLAAQGFRALLIVPVAKDDDVSGVLVLAGVGPTDWSPAAGPLVHALASSCCQAIARRQLEQELQENLQHVQHLIDSSPIVMWRGRGEGPELDWMSSNTERLLGYDAEHIARNWADIVHPDDRLEYPAAIERARQAGGESHYVTRFRHADGGWGVWQVFLQIEFDDTGAASTRHGYSIEITQRQEAEEQLRRVQRLDALGQLAGAVAHDFNNLLTVIYGYVDLARQGRESDELEEALHATERAKELVGQLLTFSRHTPVATTTLDVDSAVRSMRSMVAPLLGPDIEVVTDLAADVPVTAAAVQLDQVVLNLMLNARDAMPDGGTIRIATDVVRQSGDDGVGPSVLLSVTDTGVGMTEDVVSRAFDPFFTTKGGTGTGLGLATVYGTVRTLGGSVSIDSLPGRGTCVTVLLPVGGGVTEAPERQAAGEAVAGALVLVVDDHPKVLDLTRRALELDGHTVITANDGETALRLAATHRIDLVVTDVSMPDMNGSRLVAALRDRHPGLRAVFISGYTDDDLSLDDRTTFLQKPFSIRDLTDGVAEALRSA